MTLDDDYCVKDFQGLTSLAWLPEFRRTFGGSVRLSRINSGPSSSQKGADSSLGHEPPYKPYDNVGSRVVVNLSVLPTKSGESIERGGCKPLRWPHALLIGH